MSGRELRQHMKGLELAKKYYEEFGAPMIHEQFPEYEGVIAAGLCGSGSECFGFDDITSSDHDFEPGFCLFIPGEDVIDSRTEFRLERAYAKLPKEYEGYKKSLMPPVGGNRKGVIRISAFAEEKLGRPDGNPDKADRLRIPDQYLAEFTNGEIFRDDLGLLTSMRREVRRMDEDVRLKKLAGCLITMAQAGQYNYRRCLAHGETAAAQLAVYEFVKAGMQTAFLLNREYMPYYKWSFRALTRLPKLSLSAPYFELLLTTPNEGEYAEEKYYIIEQLATDFIGELIEQGITKANCADLEKHAYSVNDFIQDPSLRNENIFYAV